MKKFPRYIALLTIAVSVLGFQFGTLTAAHADTDADLRINAVSSFTNGGVMSDVCNDGPSSVTQFVLSYDFTNYERETTFTTPFGNAPTDLGFIDPDTLTWNGIMDSGQCVSLASLGEPTGSVGSTVEATVHIVSSVLSDSSVNVDPNLGNNDATMDPTTVELQPDLTLSTRLATTGEITPTSHLVYEATVENTGEGSYVDNGFFMIAFLVPENATFEDITDADANDPVSPAGACQSPGTLASLGFSALSQYSGLVEVCPLQTTDDIAPGDSFKLNFNIIAGDDFAAGNAEVVGIMEGNDRDTLRLLKSVSLGEDPFLQGNDNIVHLAYDPSELSVNVDRCPGQGETTTDGTGCFRITFSKLIYIPSFTAADIDLGGNGEVDSLTRLDSFTWELRVKNIPLNATVHMLLNLNGIQDLSAVQNTTQVLGINTIRYESTSGSASGSTSANGTLAQTGMRKPDFATPAVLLLLGMVLLGFAKRRKVAL